MAGMSGWRRIFPPLLVAAAIIGLSIPGWQLPLQRDQGVYAACGSFLAAGEAPYQSCWDTKAPLTHYTYALAQVLFGTTLASPYILNALWAAVTALVLVALARIWWPERDWWGLGLLYGLLLVSVPFDMNAQTEGFANLPLALGVLILSRARERAGSRWHYLLGGGLLGLAGLFKYTLVLPGAMLGLAAWLGLPDEQRHNRRQWLTLGGLGAGGALGVWGVFAVVLWMWGALPLFIEHLHFMLVYFPRVQVNPDLLLFPGESGPPLFYWQRTVREFWRLPVLYVAGFAGLAVAWRSERRWLAGMLLAWAGAALLTVYPQKVFTLYHWLLLLPPMVLGVGVGWRVISERMPSIGSYRLLAGLLVLALGANVVTRYYIDQWGLLGPYLAGDVTREELYTSQAVQDELEIAAYIAERTTPDDLIYVWGNHSVIYYMAERQAPTRFIFNSPLMAQIEGDPYQEAWLDEVLAGLYAHPPAYFVVTWYDRTWFDYINPVDQIAAMPAYQQFLDTYYVQEHFLGRFAIHRLIPWWSRQSRPELLDRVTVFDLLDLLPEATQHPAPNTPIEVLPFEMPGDTTYPTLFMHPEGRVEYQLHLPAEGPLCLRADLALAPESWGWGSDGVTFVVTVNGEPVLEQFVGNQPEDRRWHPVLVDLSMYAGETVMLSLSTSPGPSADFTGDQAGWGLPRVVQAPGASCAAVAVVR